MSPTDLANIFGVCTLMFLGLLLGFCSWLFFVMESDIKEHSQLNSIGFSILALAGIGCFVGALSMAYTSWS